jgi:hypothetical protein
MGAEQSVDLYVDCAGVIIETLTSFLGGQNSFWSVYYSNVY